MARRELKPRATKRRRSRRTPATARTRDKDESKRRTTQGQTPPHRPIPCCGFPNRPLAHCVHPVPSRTQAARTSLHSYSLSLYDHACRVRHREDARLARKAPVERGEGLATYDLARDDRRPPERATPCRGSPRRDRVRRGTHRLRSCRRADPFWRDRCLQSTSAVGKSG